MDGPDAEVRKLAVHALALIEPLKGNVEFARRTWAAAFEEAEILNIQVLRSGRTLSLAARRLHRTLQFREFCHGDRAAWRDTYRCRSCGGQLFGAFVSEN